MSDMAQLVATRNSIPANTLQPIANRGARNNANFRGRGTKNGDSLMPTI
jgi:hypothetical protein